MDTGDEAAALARELRVLCRGRGVLAADLRQRMGPHLTARLDGADRRATFSDWLREQLKPLPKDLRVAAAVGLGLHPDAESPFLGERLQWLIRYLDREERTARRRLDEAILLLAEAIVAGGVGTAPVVEAPSDRWYLRAITTLVVLDGPEPEVFEQRTIVSTASGLSALTVAMSVGQADDGRHPEVRASVLYGGLLTRSEHPSASQFRFVVELPEPLGPNATHRFCLRYRLRSGDTMPPHYAHVPLSRCDEFGLRIRFPLPAPRVWLASGALPRSLDDAPTTPPDVEPDRAGEVVASFANLKIGHAYGFRWARN